MPAEKKERPRQMEEKTLIRGTVVHVKGIPVKLLHDVEVECGTDLDAIGETGVENPVTKE